MTIAQSVAVAPWFWILLALVAVAATVFWLAGRGGDNARIPAGKQTGRDDPAGDHSEFKDDQVLKN